MVGHLEDQHSKGAFKKYAVSGFNILDVIANREEQLLHQRKLDAIAQRAEQNHHKRKQLKKSQRKGINKTFHSSTQDPIIIISKGTLEDFGAEMSSWEQFFSLPLPESTPHVEPAVDFGFDDQSTPSSISGHASCPVGFADYQLHANQPIQDPKTGQIHFLTFPLAKWDALGVALGPSGPSP